MFMKPAILWKLILNHLFYFLKVIMEPAIL